jgi:hypothetical protein
MSVIVAILLGVVVVFAIARVLFGAAIAVGLAGVVGACFGGPPGAGVGIVLGIVLVPITSLLSLLAVPDDDSDSNL